MRFAIRTAAGSSAGRSRFQHREGRLSALWARRWRSSSSAGIFTVTPHEPAGPLLSLAIALQFLSKENTMTPNDSDPSAPAPQPLKDLPVPDGGTDVTGGRGPALPSPDISKTPRPGGPVPIPYPI